jgi:hypothetical protein
MEQEELDVVPQETQGSAEPAPSAKQSMLGPTVEEIWIQPPARESPLEGCSVLTAGLGDWRHCGGRWAAGPAPCGGSGGEGSPAGQHAYALRWRPGG